MLATRFFKCRRGNGFHLPRQQTASQTDVTLIHTKNRMKLLKIRDRLQCSCCLDSHVEVTNEQQKTLTDCHFQTSPF